MWKEKDKGSGLVLEEKDWGVLMGNECVKTIQNEFIFPPKKLNL